MTLQITRTLAMCHIPDMSKKYNTNLNSAVKNPKMSPLNTEYSKFLDNEWIFHPKES